MMKITFVSNYYNHHQHPLCDALHRQCESFFFISTGVMRDERRQLGYGIAEPDYVLHAYEEACAARAKACVQEADVIIFGAAQGALANPKIYQGKTVFYYSERIYKRGCRLWLLPVRAIKYYYKYRWKQKSLLLCASGYAAYDFSLTRTFRGKCYRWGYFPETKRYDIKKLIAQKNPQKILWCGRLIDWKHPELAVETAARLRNAGVDFSMDIIGSGAMESELRKQIEDYGLADRVKLLGSMPPQKTREHMERAGILLFTSDRQEGWGAVLNEAMNSGCAVVASDAAGSVPFLLKNGENGFSFHSGDSAELFEKTRVILKQPALAAALGEAAYETISTTWNAETAARRLLQFAEYDCAEHSLPPAYESGPLSKAPIIRDFETKEEFLSCKRKEASD